jgi:hypothetical protein
MRNHIDDPQWTAYALGELSAAEKTEAEAFLAADPNLRGEVEDLKQTLALLQAEFKQSTAPAFDPLRREMILNLSGSLKKMPLWVWLPSAAAAMLAIGLGIAHFLSVPPAIQPEMTEIPAQETMADAFSDEDKLIDGEGIVAESKGFDQSPRPASAPAAVIRKSRMIEQEAPEMREESDVMTFQVMGMSVAADAEMIPTPTPTPTPTPEPGPGVLNPITSSPPSGQGD